LVAIATVSPPPIAPASAAKKYPLLFVELVFIYKTYILSLHIIIGYIGFKYYSHNPT